ncbi:LacI family DNA-binding transcriptional regulator [Oenococcus sicerae]|uniref:LacI family DNA-binding transcriptional regulator n=1 Tax=Oenococcus sicerae TaxID=2203724 RepID=UPI0010B2BD02|nr:HTH-type transcriptional repressor PurR [Oenococcus sicerae]
MVAKLQDVAKAAGVTITTVSRVLNDFPHVSKKTHDKVYAAIRALNYHPNALARSLQGKSSKFIGLIFPTIANPFFSELANELEVKLSAKGYKIIIASSANNVEAERRYLGMLAANMVEGIITGSHNLGIEEYKDVNMPIVSFDRFLSEEIPIVSSNNYQGGTLAVDYLVKQGAKKIAIITDEDDSDSPTSWRAVGAEKAIKQAGIQSQQFAFPDSQFTESEKAEELRSLLASQEFDGIFANNDTTALLIKKIIKENNFNEVPIIGYDGTDFIRHYLTDVATIVQPIPEIADALIDLLFRRIEKPDEHFKNPEPLTVQLFVN